MKKIVMMMVLTCLFFGNTQALTTFYAIDESTNSPKLVQFNSDPLNTTVTEIATVSPEAVLSSMDFSNDGRLFSVRGKNLYEINPTTGATIDFMQVHTNNGLEGVAVNSQGLVYVYVEHNVDIIEVDFDLKTQTTVLDMPYDSFDWADMDFDADENLINIAGGRIVHTPIDGSSPVTLANFSTPSGVFTSFSSVDSAFYTLDLTRSELWRLDWADGQSVGSPYFVKTVGDGTYGSIATIPEPCTLILLSLGGILIRRKK